MSIDRALSSVRSISRLYVGAFFLAVAALILQSCVWVPLQPPTYEGGPVHVSVMHQVQAGETLEDIARNYNSTPWAIAVVNKLSSLDTPPVGTELRIPRTSMSLPALRELLHKPSLEFLKRSPLIREGTQEPALSNDQF
ncbi:MAG: LysM peptidoglycan-binding domain-containing protein [Candidatus Sumerlaeaceae bacterium]